MSSGLAGDPRDLIYNDRFRRQSHSSIRSTFDDPEMLRSAIYSMPGIKTERTTKPTGWLDIYPLDSEYWITDSELIGCVIQDWIEPPIDSISVDTQTESFDISTAVAAIRAHFSLQIKELALILGVQRPTIYAWLRDEAKPQPENRHRISQVLRLVRRWKELGGKPLGELVRYHIDQDGRTLVDLLSEKTLDERQITSCLSRLAGAKFTPSPSLSEIAEKEGIDLSRVSKSDLEFDVLTGRSFDEE